MTSLETYLKSLLPYNDELVKEIYSFSYHKKYKKGEVILEDGYIPENLYFIETGIIRGYIKLDNNKEYNKVFFIESEMASSISSLIQQKPSIVSLDCLEDTTVLVINYEKLIRLRDKYPMLYKIHIKVLEEYYLKREAEIIELATKLASERYLSLRERIKNLDNRIPQYHIASYLGITSVQMSRIKKNLK